MSAPIGQRSLSRRFVIDAPVDRVCHALHPFGQHITWNQVVSSVTRFDDTSGRMVTTHIDRIGGFIERDFLIDTIDDYQWRMKFASDSSLAQDFWKNHFIEVKLQSLGLAKTEIVYAESDSYKGVSLLINRFFAMRRMVKKLTIWAVEDSFERGGVFERPSTQIFMAALSALILWPVFGLNIIGLFLAFTLTLVVALHELGHIISFRLAGHKTARMIFIPILGGFAMGGRPYNKHFEVAFSALMGAGFSAFLVAVIMLVETMLKGEGARAIQTFVLICGLFNLGNLIPVWKFDGSQVVRQIFRTPLTRVISIFVLLGWYISLSYALGLPDYLIFIGFLGFLLIGLMTAQSGIKPNTPLIAMSVIERLSMLSALFAVLSIHATAILWSMNKLFV